MKKTISHLLSSNMSYLKRRISSPHSESDCKTATYYKVTVKDVSQLMYYWLFNVIYTARHL